jgi:hypothetical protein
MVDITAVRTKTHTKLEDNNQLGSVPLECGRDLLVVRLVELSRLVTEEL